MSILKVIAELNVAGRLGPAIQIPSWAPERHHIASGNVFVRDRHDAVYQKQVTIQKVPGQTMYSAQVRDILVMQTSERTKGPLAASTPQAKRSESSELQKGRDHARDGLPPSPAEIATSTKNAP